MARKPTKAQRALLEYILANGSEEGFYEEAVTDHSPRCFGQFSVMAVSRTMDACLRHGWTRMAPCGGYELTDSGRAVLAPNGT